MNPVNCKRQIIMPVDKVDPLVTSFIFSAFLTPFYFFLHLFLQHDNTEVAQISPTYVDTYADDLFLNFFFHILHQKQKNSVTTTTCTH